MTAAQREEISGTTEVSWLRPDTIKTTWNGRIDGTAMRNQLTQMEQALAEKKVRFWFSDTSRVTNYSVDIRKPSIDLLSFLKSRGLEEIVGVVDSPAIRMLSMSLSFVVGLRVKVFPSADEALIYLTRQTGD